MIAVYAAVSTTHEQWTKVMGLEGKTAAEGKTTLLGDDHFFGKWAPELQELLAIACDEDTKDNPGREANIKPIYMLPVGFRSEHQVCATLVGDAAHLMTSWSGEGVNSALWDSLDLAHVLAAVPESLDAVSWQAALDPPMQEFEYSMMTRAKVKAEESLRNKNLFLSENGEHVQKFLWSDTTSAIE